MAGKYAVSLYVTAVRANALEPIYEELTELLKASEKSPTFLEFLKDMSVSNKNKVKAVQSLLGELGFSDITTNFLGNILSFYIHKSQFCNSGINVVWQCDLFLV